MGFVVTFSYMCLMYLFVLFILSYLTVGFLLVPNTSPLRYHVPFLKPRLHIGSKSFKVEGLKSSKRAQGSVKEQGTTSSLATEQWKGY